MKTWGLKNGQAASKLQPHSYALVKKQTMKHSLVRASSTPKLLGCVVRAKEGICDFPEPIGGNDAVTPIKHRHADGFICANEQNGKNSVRRAGNSQSNFLLNVIFFGARDIYFVFSKNYKIGI